MKGREEEEKRKSAVDRISSLQKKPILSRGEQWKRAGLLITKGETVFPDLPRLFWKGQRQKTRKRKEESRVFRKWIFADRTFGKEGSKREEHPPPVKPWRFWKSVSFHHRLRANLICSDTHFSWWLDVNRGPFRFHCASISEISSHLLFP